MDGSGAYMVHRPAHWIFEGLDLKRDDEFGGMGGVTPEEVFRAARIASGAADEGVDNVKATNKARRRSSSVPRCGTTLEQECIVTPEDIFQAAKIAQLSPSRPSVGMARVKALNKKKTRSSSAPRPGRSTDCDLMSFF